MFDFARVLIHIYPVELGRVVGNGRHQAFTLPAPVVVGVGQEIACEWVVFWMAVWEFF
jgi:hypothetical protein